MASTHARWPSWNSPLGDNPPHFLHPNDFQFAGFLRVGVPVGTNNGVVWWNEGGRAEGGNTLFVLFALFIDSPLHSTCPSPSKPGLHLQTYSAGRLQHSALSTHLRASSGIWHSSISGKTMLLNVCMLCCTILPVNMLRYLTTTSTINPG